MSTETDELGIWPEFRRNAGPLSPWLWFRLGHLTTEIGSDVRFAGLQAFVPDSTDALSGAWLGRLHVELVRLHGVLVSGDMPVDDQARSMLVAHLQVLVGELLRQHNAAVALAQKNLRNLP